MDLCRVDMLMQDLLSDFLHGIPSVEVGWENSGLLLSPPEDAAMGPLTTHVGI